MSPSKFPEPCPFCKSKQVFVKTDKDESYVCCKMCNARGPTSWVRVLAIKLWNKYEE